MTESDLRALARKHGTDDLHVARAAEIFKVAPGDVTRDQRAIAKERNYYVFYAVSGKINDLGVRRS